MNFNLNFEEIKKRLKTKQAIVITAVIAVILIAGGLFWLNPAKKLMNNRNAQRRQDIVKILSAFYLYNNENPSLMEKLSENPIEICKSQSQNCDGLIDLSVLTNDKTFKKLPEDPRNESEKGIGYKINKTANNRVTITAIYPEGGVIISTTR
jgi:hypothetical protein